MPTSQDVYIAERFGHKAGIVFYSASDPSGFAIPLAALPIGGRGRLCAKPDGASLARRLGELGFVPGTEVRLVRRAPLGDPIEIELRGYRVCLRRDQLSGLFVEPIDESSP